MSKVHAKALAMLVAAICLAQADTALSEGWDAAISTGRKGGRYFDLGTRFQSTLQAQHGLEIHVETSSGSIQNLARLADRSSEIALALTQTDALDQFRKSNAEFAKQFIVLGDVGKECVILITGKKSGILSFSRCRNDLYPRASSGFKEEAFSRIAKQTFRGDARVLGGGDRTGS